MSSEGSWATEAEYDEQGKVMSAGPKWTRVRSGYPYTTWEIEMQAASYALRQKVDWQTKRLDQVIAAKWKAEILEQSAAGAQADLVPVEGEPEANDWQARKLTEAHVDYVLAELEWHARELEKAKISSCVDGVWESSALVPAELKERLKREVNKLEDVPADQKDWHPGSDEQVLDLVHPSLYPVQWGKTVVKLLDGSSFVPADADAFQQKVTDGLVRTDAGDVEVHAFVPAVRNMEHEIDTPAEPRFQWLPTDFDVDANGGVKLAEGSYINNLKPDTHKELYGVVEELLGSSLPLFERVLGDLAEEPAKRIEAKPYDWWTSWQDFEKNQGEDNNDEDDWDRYERVKKFTVPEPKPLDLESKVGVKPHSLAGRRLQVIVKLANIVLTPEKPSYAGGSWHVEGVESESIIASSILYYDNTNVTASSLSFRRSFDEYDVEYEQSDTRGCRIAYALEDEQACNQSFNAATTTEDKWLSFPNIYQHLVSPFELEDKTQPGHRKIVCFFLVDPYVRVPSGITVAPQQRDWYESEIFQGGKKVTPKDGGKGVGLPPETWAEVLGNVGGLMSLDEAKKVREELMKERKHIINAEGEIMFAREFSLCEH